MGHGPTGESSELPIHVASDGGVYVDVGTRFVETSLDDLERILERLAADRGRVRILVEPGPPDDGDEPADRELDRGAGPAASIIAMVESFGLDAGIEEVVDVVESSDED